MKIRPFKRLEFWAALALILFFFIPWTTLRGNPLNGYQLAATMRQSSSLSSAFASTPTSYGAFNHPAPDPPDTSGMALTALLIYLIPIAAALAILVDPITHNSRPGIVYFLLAILPFIILAILLSKLGTDIFQTMTLGAYLTLAAAFLCAIGLIRSPKAPNKSPR